MDVRLPDGTVLQNVPDGMSKADLIGKLKTNGYDTSSFEPAAVSAGKELNSIPRQLGLTARYAMEGPSEAAQIVTEPIAGLMRMAGINTAPLGKVASNAADWLGLPKPQNANERVIADASKLVSGSIAPMKAGQLLASGAQQLISNAAQRVTEPGKLLAIKDAISGGGLSGLSAAPLSQGLAAAGAGLAGGASREAGGDWLQQGIASAVGGVAGGLAPGLATGAANMATNGIKSLMPKNQADIDAKISLILQNQGIDFSQLSRSAQNALRSDLSRAVNLGQQIDPAAAARLADFRATGTTPTLGMITQNPVQITKERNLSKIAANSSDGQLHGLPMIENQNNAALIRNLNNAGAAEGDIFRAGKVAVSNIGAKDTGLKNTVTGLYDTARNMPGGNTPLDRKPFIDNIYANLAENNKMAFLPDNIGALIDQISLGKVSKGGKDFNVPFDANALDNLLTTIATAQRGTTDGNVKAALKAVRDGIDKTQITPVKTQFGGNQLVTQEGANFLRQQDAQAGDFMSALNQARDAHRQRMGWQESSRPVEAALSGAAPDNFIKKFVIGGDVRDAQALAQEVGPAGLGEIKNALLDYLKKQAVSGASDEVGKFSQAAFNKALNGLGDRKLGVFFSSEELASLRANGRVASYMQSQPVGSAVNNSNSGALMVGKVYDAIRSGVGMLPGVGPVGAGLLDVTLGNPTKNAANWLNTRQAQNIQQGLLMEQPKQRLINGLVGPGVAMGGLFAAP